MIEEVAPHYEEIKEAVLRVMKDLVAHQTPIMIQPVWKTTGKNFRLAEDCLDVFVWSDIATLKMSIDTTYTLKDINRFQRTIIGFTRCCSTMLPLDSLTTSPSSKTNRMGRPTTKHSLYQAHVHSNT